MDYLCSTHDTLAVGAGEWLHDWRIHSCPAGDRNRCCVDQNHSGTKTFLTFGMLETQLPISLPQLHVLTLQLCNCTYGREKLKG